MDLAFTEGASIVGDDGIRPAPLWAIRLLAASAFGVCLYLSWTALQLSGPVGCGAAAGCAEVLGSRWSKWLGVPVSAPAATVYLSILIASFWIGRGRSATARRRATAIVAAAALVAGGAAIWFVYLQAAVVEQVCPYCLAAHACGILIAVLLLLNLRVAAPRFTWTTPALAGAVGVCILVAGQFIVKPQTYQVDVAGSAAEPACLPSEAACLERRSCRASAAGCHWLWHCSSRHYSLWHWRAAAVLCHAGELRRTGPRRSAGSARRGLVPSAGGMVRLAAVESALRRIAGGPAFYFDDQRLRLSPLPGDASCREPNATALRWADFLAGIADAIGSPLQSPVA